MSTRHLATGSPLPEVNPDLLRIYSMLFCPFAERTRLVLAHKNIPHETVNVNLKNKPAWLFERNPLGAVPVIEYKGHVLHDSAICNEFLEDAFPGTAPLLPSDPFKRAAEKLFMTLSDNKISRPFYGLYRATTPEKVQEEYAEWLKSLQYFENQLTSLNEPFFGGAQVGMGDLHIWPFFERVPTVSELRSVDLLPATSFPRLAAWVAAMENAEAVKKCKLSKDVHKRFVESYLAGQPDYDIEQ
jgi:glutathione S-transferase